MNTCSECKYFKRIEKTNRTIGKYTIGACFVLPELSRRSESDTACRYFTAPKKPVVPKYKERI